VTATTAYAPIPDSARQLSLLHARGLITQQVHEGLSQTVALIADAGEANRQAIERLRQEILHATPDEQPSPYLKIATDSAAANMHVVASGGKLQIYNANGVLLVEPTDIQVQGQSDAGAVVQALESIVHYQAILALKSQGQDSSLIGKIKLRLRHHVVGHPRAQAQPLPAAATGRGGELTVYFHPKQKDQNQYIVDVINESELEVYAHVFTLSPDYSISRLYPRLGQQEAIKPGNTFAIPQSLQCYLPDGWDASHDYVKVFVTTVPTDLGVLEQKGLKVPPPKRVISRDTRAVSRLRHIIDVATYGAGARFIGPTEIATEEDWAVAELPITTVRVFDWAKLDSAARDIPLSDGLTLIKPSGFRGQVTATTWGQATRGVDSDPALKPPPGLERFPNLFQPLGRSGTRSVGSTNLVLALNVDEHSRRSVTQKNSLRLKIPVTPDEQVADLLAVAFDGEDYLLVGYADGPNTVKIVSLPEMKGTSKRGLTAALKLFIYKKMGRSTPSLGLHRAELRDGEVVYSDIQHNQFQPGQKVAVFVHGSTSDTRWMIQGLAQFLRKEVLPYDHLLTWDYESFGIPL
jgi:hypothetical protein